MSDKPQKDQKEKKKKRRSSVDAGLRKFLTVLLSLIAVFMTVLVIYTLRHSTTDPTVTEGITKDWVPVTTVAEVTELTEATEATEETEPADPVLYAAQQTLESMTLEEKVYQLFFVSNRDLTGRYYAETAGDETREALANMPVGGIVFDNENVSGREQLVTMIENTKSYSKIPLLIGIEEEGGLNSYLDDYGITGYYDQMGVYGVENETERVYQIGSEIGIALTGVGFNIDLAPVADTLTNTLNTEVGRRAFSTDPEITAGLVTQMVRGLHSGGCMSCLKYFPGLSASYTDSRYGMPVSNQTMEELQSNLLAFSMGIENGADMVMVSHLCLPNIVGEERPSCMSAAIVSELLRGQLGYDGVVMTDSFRKAAISENYDAGVAAVAAIEAGCDIIYRPDDLSGAAKMIIEAVNSGVLTEERIDRSVLRILMLKYENGLEG